MSLATYWQSEVQAKADAEQAQLAQQARQQAETPQVIRLSFWAGEFTFQNGEKKATGKVNKADYKGHVDKLVARAHEVAKEQKANLLVSDAGSVVLNISKDYSK